MCVKAWSYWVNASLLRPCQTSLETGGTPDCSQQPRPTSPCLWAVMGRRHICSAEPIRIWQALVDAPQVALQAISVNLIEAIALAPLQAKLHVMAVCKRTALCSTADAALLAAVTTPAGRSARKSLQVEEAAEGDLIRTADMPCGGSLRAGCSNASSLPAFTSALCFLAFWRLAQIWMLQGNITPTEPDWWTFQGIQKQDWPQLPKKGFVLGEVSHIPAPVWLACKGCLSLHKQKMKALGTPLQTDYLCLHICKLTASKV